MTPHQPADRKKSLAFKAPILAKEWHPTKNGELTPWDLSAGSGISVWWLCRKRPRVANKGYSSNRRRWLPVLFGPPSKRRQFAWHEIPWKEGSGGGYPHLFIWDKHRHALFVLAVGISKTRDEITLLKRRGNQDIDRHHGRKDETGNRHYRG